MDEIFEALPNDETGAETQSRYRWHSALAAIDGLRLLGQAIAAPGNVAEQSDDKIVCEFVGEWFILRGGQAEIVVCKHVDPSRGPITGPLLLTSLGLPELFRSWLATNETASCRLVTNAGIAPRLQAAITSLRDQQPSESRLDLQEPAAALVASIVNGLDRDRPYNGEATTEASPPSDELKSQVTRFLSILAIESAVAGGESIGYLGSAQHVAPLLHRLDLRADAADAVWAALNIQFAGAMSGRRPVTVPDLLRTMRRMAPAAARVFRPAQTDHPGEPVLDYFTMFAAAMSVASGGPPFQCDRQATRGRTG